MNVCPGYVMISAFFYSSYCIGVVGLCRLGVYWGVGGMSAQGISGYLHYSIGNTVLV